jgi:hypothetical protein
MAYYNLRNFVNHIKTDFNHFVDGGSFYHNICFVQTYTYNQDINFSSGIQNQTSAVIYTHHDMSLNV